MSANGRSRRFAIQPPPFGRHRREETAGEAPIPWSLDIGELSPQLQVKPLRVLQYGEFERVGGTSPLRTDARIIAATNRDLEEGVACSPLGDAHRGV